MIKISRKTKSELFTALKNEVNPFGREDGSDWIMGFLGDVWDLRAMPSEDPRYNDAYGDIYQHTVRNNDYETDYLFLERLKLFDDDEIFNKFIETIVSSNHRENEDEIIKFVLLINSYLEKEKIALIVTGYDVREFPIYSIQIKIVGESMIDLPPNNINFKVVKSHLRRFDKFSSHTPPTIFPSFVLVHNENWNDYSKRTEFALFFYKNEEEHENIGTTKITNGKDSNSASVLPESFTQLPSDFCSLGQEYDYYRKLKDATGRVFESVLFALRDAAFFPEINDIFEKNNIFRNSLIRFDEAERLLREAKHKIYGYDLKKLYSFKYSFTPKYTKESLEVEFDFNNQTEVPNRIYALIGNNGTGKTQLITSLPLGISQKKNDLFFPRPPLFSKVIAVSYSIFDDFEIPNKTSSFNYVYCGISNIKEDKKETLSPTSQLQRFHHTWKKIKELERMDKWRSILLNFIDSNLIDTFIVKDSEQDNSLTVNVNNFTEVRKKLSSGQSIILYIISEIVANIRLDSLILFDEPETHLHPNAVSQLMNTINELIHEFDSYCIITTHSPLVIQELLSRNVYVIERHEDIPSVRKIGIESFGENLTVLTEEVFGNRVIEKSYKKIINNLVDLGKSYAEIIDQLETDNVPLSLNARLYIKSQLTR